MALGPNRNYYSFSPRTEKNDAMAADVVYNNYSSDVSTTVNCTLSTIVYQLHSNYSHQASVNIFEYLHSTSTQRRLEHRTAPTFAVETSRHTSTTIIMKLLTKEEEAAHYRYGIPKVEKHCAMYQC